MLSKDKLDDILRFRNPVDRSKSQENDQPGTQQRVEPKFERGKEPYLVFKNVPASLSLQNLIYLCSDFGKVLRAQQHKQFKTTFFVNFVTLNDLLNVLEGFKSNSLGITIELGKIVVDKLNETQQSIEQQRAIDRIQQRTVLSERQSKDEINNYIQLRHQHFKSNIPQNCNTHERKSTTSKKNKHPCVIC